MDKRRYVSRHPSPNRDKVVGMGADVTGNAAADGFTTRYRSPLERPAYSRDNNYREYYVCSGLMDEDEARSSRFMGEY